MHSGRSDAGSPLRHSFFRIPAILALLTQLAAFAVSLSLAYLLPPLTGVQLSIAVAALIQGVVAAAMARLMRMAPWWMLIQFFFPIAVVVSAAVHLAPSLYLVAFLLLLVLFWSTFRTQVPFYPSHVAVWRCVAELLPNGQTLRIADVGSGFGGMVMHLARTLPENEVVGIELAPLPWLCSLIRGRACGSAGRFLRGDYNGLDFGSFDVVFAYLSPTAMPALWRKAHTEMRKGGLLLSYEFDIPGVEPDMVVFPLEGGPRLYGWRIG